MVLIFIVFLLLLILGVPVAFATGIAGTLYFLKNIQIPMKQIAQLALTQVQNVNLLAVPLFIFAGNLMNSSGITARLLGLADVLTGHMKGGMAQTSVVMSTLMGGVSGSSTADAAMESRILGPTMLKSGYPRGYAAVVIGYTSLITSTIPPGINLVVYGTSGGVSIGKLFMGGLMVGIYMMITLMIVVSITSHKRGFKSSREKRATIKEIFDNVQSSFWALLFPIILLVGIRLGLFTSYEVGAFACVYAMVIGFFVYKELTWKTFKETVKNSAIDVGGIMLIMAMTGIFGYGVNADKVPQTVTKAMLSISSNPTIVMLMILILLFLLGMFMDGGAIVLLLTPILLPVARSVGMDPVFFGLIMCTICCLGILTPPVGIAMYVVCGVLDVPMKKWMKESIPFLVAVLILLIVLILFPQLVTFLPNLVYN